MTLIYSIFDFRTRFTFLSMNTTYPILSSRPVQPHISTICSNQRCNVPLEFPVRSPLPRPGTLLQVRCFACQNVLSHAFYPGQIPLSSHSAVGSGQRTPNGDPKSSQSGSGAGSQQRKGRKIGTQERPLETGYYDILGVPVNATTDDIKKAYSKRLLSFSIEFKTHFRR